MKMITYILKVFLIIALLLSCYTAPSPIFRLYPIAIKTTWLFGKEFSKQSSDGLTIAAAFEKYTSQYFVFDINIVNRSNKEILVSP